MEFNNPWFLLLLLVIPLYIWRRIQSQQRGLPLSDGGSWKGLPASLRSSWVILPDILLLLTLVLIVLAMARPRKPTELVEEHRQGVAIEMVIDRSSSMSAPVQGSTLNRLDLLKQVFRDFLLGDEDDLQGRPNDLVGLISFARYADTHAPLTLSHRVVAQMLDSINLVDRESEDGTSIGDAVALAAARLQNIKEQEGYDITGKMIILFTDGSSNAGKYDPMDAAKIAQEWGIRIYSIGYSDSNPLLTLLGARGAMGEQTLRDMAELTGGALFEATNS
ncbi:MAG: VWA domain-containing protein, partial [Spirochaetaceae bacterium]|nr:VWA domain-containing protein [Spirochaetaceae bacterium]